MHVLRTWVLWKGAPEVSLPSCRRMYVPLVYLGRQHSTKEICTHLCVLEHSSEVKMNHARASAYRFLLSRTLIPIGTSNIPAVVLPDGLHVSINVLDYPSELRRKRKSQKRPVITVQKRPAITVVEGETQPMRVRLCLRYTLYP